MDKIFTSQNLLLDIDVKDQKDAFVAIATKAKELGVTNDPEGLVSDFLKRESVSTTGLSNQVAIPHAMNADFIKPAIIVARFKNPVDWKAYDGQPTKVAIALLIPEKNRSDMHMQYLQNVSLALLDEKFNNVILNSTNIDEIVNIVDSAINGNLKKEEEQKVANNDAQNTKGLIIGVSSCATGVAHTYMAREALEKHAKDVGYDVWIETQGQSGQEHKLTDELISKADYVVIASDINVELDRFNGKKIYMTDTNEAINTPVKTLEKTINSKTIYGQKVEGSNSSNTSDGFASAVKKGKFMPHFLNGVSHMIPFIVFSGILYAILNAVAVGIYGDGNTPPDGSIMSYLLMAANVGFTLFTGVMGGYIAVSIGGRAALAPGFIATFVAGSPNMYIKYTSWMEKATIGSIEVSGISLGIVAAIMMGFGAGHLVKWINTWKIHKHIKPIMPLIIIPVLGSSVLIFPFLFLLSGILGCAMNWFGAGLAFVGTHPAGRVGIGLLFGAMVGFDMGGPINKIAVATATSLIQVDPSLMGAVAAAIPIAPLGCGIASVILGRSLFDDNEKGLGVSALILGFMGISEGAIPFAAKRLKKTAICNIIGSAVAGILACLFYVGGHVGMWGGLAIIFCFGIYAGGGSLSGTIPVPFAVHGGGASVWNALISSGWYIVAIAAGAIVHALIYVTLIRSEKGGGFIKNFTSMFKRKTKLPTPNKVDTTVNQPSKFNEWYFNNVINENWYYRTKVRNLKAIEW